MTTVVAELTPALFAVILLVTTIGATLQGAVGFGMGLFVAPILLLIEPAFVPGPTLATGILLTLAMSWRDRSAIVVENLAWSIGGRIVGIAAALGFLTIVSADLAEPILGMLVLLGVVLSALGGRVRPMPRALVGAGAVSGFMATTVSIGGPPIALLYQHEPGPRVRGTLSAYFTIGGTLSVIGLGFVGRFGLDDVWRVGVLLPGTAVGFLLSGRLTPVLDRGLLRPAILALAAIMGVAVIGRGVFG